ncbi:MAG: hypothetical protein J7M39_07435 [Anaerolineae bacterium]|nr:hypothetical protein [Anaerolineae bacterium]
MTLRPGHQCHRILHHTPLPGHVAAEAVGDDNLRPGRITDLDLLPDIELLHAIEWTPDAPLSTGSSPK